MASDWQCVINSNTSKICYSGGDIAWHPSSSKECSGSCLPLFFSQWEKEKRRKEWQKRISLWRQNIVHLVTVHGKICISIPNISPNPVCPHPNFQFICINLRPSWDQSKEDRASRVGNRRLSLARKHRPARASSRMRASWMQGGVGIKQWWHYSQSRATANQKEECSGHMAEERARLSGCPRIQINPIPQWSRYKKTCFVSM